MLKPGMMLGDRYEIIELVGSGGMSEVYKAKDHKLNRYVAVKVLKSEFSDDRNFVSKFRVEAQSAAGLAHPNIVNVYDVGEDEGIYYIVMEFVEGITLKEYIRNNGRLTAEQALEFALQIASGIEVAHQNHTIHRDIKPQNIIVSKNGMLKVTDFGIARAATSNTVATSAMGSVHYVSPEQARGGYSDEKSDIYSLGITMYEMVTGRVPFEGDNNVTVALMHIQGEMIPPREYYPDIPASFEKVILKCTQKKPERRYLTSSALIADLKRVASNPNGDFVVMGSNTSADAPTVMMSDAEMNTIKETAAQKAVEDTVDDAYSNTYKKEQPATPNRRQPVQPKAEQATVDDDFDPDDDDYNYDYDDEEDVPEDLPDNIEDDDIDPKLQKIVMIGGILAAVIIAMFIMLLVGKAAGWFKFGSGNSTENTQESQSIEMSVDVVGMDVERAEEALTAANIPYVVENANDDVIDAGIVISQSYNKGDMIPEGSKVKIVVSVGKEEVSVPNVVGYAVDRAETMLADADLDVTHAYEYSDDVEKDHVISQDPGATQMVAKGSKIKIVISNGPEVKETEVPNLRGKTQQEAAATLQNSQLNLGNVTEEYSDTVEVGYVIGQSTSQGTKLNEGATVDITISKGPEPTTEDEKPKTYAASFSGSITIDADSANTYNVEVRYVVDGTIKQVLAPTAISAASPTIDISGTLTGLASSGELQVVYDGSTTKPADVSQNVNVQLAEE